MCWEQFRSLNKACSGLPVSVQNIAFWARSCSLGGRRKFCTQISAYSAGALMWSSYIWHSAWAFPLQRLPSTGRRFQVTSICSEEQHPPHCRMEPEGPTIGLFLLALGRGDHLTEELMWRRLQGIHHLHTAHDLGDGGYPYRVQLVAVLGHTYSGRQH